MERVRPQETVVRETRRIAIGAACLTLVLIAVYAALGRLTPGVVIGALMGGAYGVFSFFMLGMTMQKAVEEKDETMARMRIRSSYSMRMAGAVLVCVLAFAFPFAEGIPCILGLLFPRVTILVLQLTGQVHD